MSEFFGDSEGATIKKVKKGVYKHFKGNYYVVLGEVIHSETREEHVLYGPLYGEWKLFVRPKKMFCDEVDRSELNYKGPRFKFVGEVGK